MLRKRDTRGLPAALPDDARGRGSVELSGAERLVAVGFRNWMLGYQTGEIACWEAAWNAYAARLGPREARVAVTALSCWVRTIAGAACRRIEVYPSACARFCRDECTAVAMVAACQHGACPALRACAFALIEGQLIDEVVAETGLFADTLRGARLVLSPDRIIDIALGEPPRPGSSAPRSLQ